MKDQTGKIRAYAKAMIGRLIAVDQKIAMLNPLLHDTDVVKKWGGSYAAHGLNLLKMTLYVDLIRELVAISLDTDKEKKSPSITNILTQIDSQGLLTDLKNEYCEHPPIILCGDAEEDSKKLSEENIKYLSDRRSRIFEDKFESVKNSFESLKKSDLCQKIRKSRNKLICHYEMRDVGEAPRMLNPSDLGLKWGDAEEYFDSIKPIINELVAIISNVCYSWDIYQTDHIKIANDFWRK